MSTAVLDAPVMERQTVTYRLKLKIKPHGSGEEYRERLLRYCRRRDVTLLYSDRPVPVGLLGERAELISRKGREFTVEVESDQSFRPVQEAFLLGAVKLFGHRWTFPFGDDSGFQGSHVQPLPGAARERLVALFGNRRPVLPRPLRSTPPRRSIGLPARCWS